MSDNDPTVTKMKLLALLIAGAPLFTLLYLAVVDAADDLVENTTDGWDWNIVALLAGANLVWVSFFVGLIWLGRQVPFARLSELALEWLASVDPNIVWQPWQALALAVVVGAVLIAVGARGVAADLTNKEEGDTNV